MKLTYAVVFEKTHNNWCAYAPDVPGCGSTGDTWEEMLEMIRKGLTGHIEIMLEYGEPLPEPKMSIEEAIAYHNEPIPDDVMESYLEHGEDTPSLATRFEFVDIEVRVPELSREAPAPSREALQPAQVG